MTKIHIPSHRESTNPEVLHILKVLHCYCASLISHCLPHPSFPCRPQSTKASAEHIVRTSYTSSQKRSTKCKWHWHRWDFMVVTQCLRGKIPLRTYTKNCRSYQSSRIRMQSFNWLSCIFCLLISETLSFYAITHWWAIIKCSTSPARPRNPVGGQCFICIAY